MNEFEIRLVIIDPALEAIVLKRLVDSDIHCSGRHLSLADIPREVRASTVVITMPSAVTQRGDGLAPQNFLALISLGDKPVTGALSLGEQQVNALPDLILKATSEGSSSQQKALERNPFINGVLPRVGAQTLNAIIEENLGAHFLPLWRRELVGRRQLFLSEIDDHSILRLCEALSGREPDGPETAVVINKIPRTSAAKVRLKALAGELQGSGIALVHPMYFDVEMQITGVPSKSTIRALQPLFDWIAKAN